MLNDAAEEIFKPGHAVREVAPARRRSVNRLPAGNVGEGAMVQQVVWGVSIVLMGTLAAVFAWVAMGASVALDDYGPAIASAYRLRTWLFGLAVIVLIGANYDTLGKLPYVSSISAPSSATATQSVEAIAEQWSWSIKPDAFRAGETVEFHVSSN